MNTKQLFRALTLQRKTAPYFNGVFCRDLLETIQSKPKLIICNTDTSEKRGKHWVLFYFNNDTVEFYDSLGKSIHSYGTEFSEFIERFSSKYKYVKKRSQPVHSNLCGVYCLYYAFWRCQGYSMERIVRSMKRPSIVKRIVMHAFHLRTSAHSALLQSCLMN